MKISVLNYFACPICHSTFVSSIHKKTKEGVLEAELKCEWCGERFYIKDGIACFVSLSRKSTENIKKLRRTTIKQEIPKIWRRLFSRQEHAALQKEWDWMLSIIKKEKDAVHLDFATGTGRFLRNIISKTKGEIIVLERDYSTCLELQYFLKKIKKYKRVSVICADARKMPFKDGIFDSVSSWHGLDEPKIENAIKESKRILKNGACFTASGIHYQKGSKSFSIAKKHDIQFIAKEAIMQAVKKTGFRKIEYKRFFQGKWNEKGSYLPVIGDFYSTYAIKAKK
ncbi:MAG: hypothetical protein Athens071424_174 [Parcubacteria group bacterium Athens0714_24]|nr:MAG: hypothetical protein Athens071424_174 [Parcubacteria group bacterium Athens0714_24]